VRGEVRETLAALDVPVVLVTHDAQDAAAFDAPTVHLDRGHVVE
jgi:ABC-type sulfate/molybdate transport systems ATPase subunit